MAYANSNDVLYANPSQVEYASPKEVLYASPEEMEQPKSSLLNSLAKGFVRGGETAFSALDYAAGGLAGLSGDTKEADRIFKVMEDRKRSQESFFRENLPSGNTFPEKIAGAIGAIPQYMTGVGAGAQILGGAQAEQQNLNEMGVDPTTAQRGAALSVGLNAIQLAIPGAGFVKGAAAGAFGASTNELGQIANLKDYKDLQKKRQEESFENVALGILIGGPAGKLSVSKQVKQETVIKLDELFAKKKEESTPPTENPLIKDSPLYAKQGELALDTPNDIDISRAINPYDLGGYITKVAQGRDTNKLPIMEERFAKDPTQLDIFYENKDFVTQPEPRQEGTPVDIEGRAGKYPKEQLFGDISRIHIPDKISYDVAGARNISSLADKSGFYDIPKTLDWISKNGREDLQYVAKYLQKFSNVFENGTVAVARDSDGNFTNSVKEISGKESSAVYITQSNAILLGKMHQSDRVLLHELLHMGTVRAYLSGQFPELSKELTQLHRAIVSRGKKQLRENDEGKPDTYYTFGKETAAHYGLSDPREMISEAFTNREFQRLLKTIKFDNRTAFQKLKDTLFGKEPKEVRTALDEVFTLSDKLIRAQEKSPALNKDFWKIDQKVADQMTSAMKAVGMSDNPQMPIDPDTMKQAAFNKIPGLRGIEYITADPDFTPEKKQEYLSAKDGSSVWGMTAGRVMRQELAKSPLIRDIGRMIHNSQSRAKLAEQQRIQPLKQTLQALKTTEERAMLNKIFLSELEIGNRVSAEELLAAGVPQKIVSAHQQMRENFDAVFEAENATRIARGKKPITKLDAYMASRWQGPYKAVVRDIPSEDYPLGKPVWYIAEKTVMGRTKALKYIEDKFPDAKITDIGFDNNFSKQKDNLISAYHDMVQLLGANDPIVQTIKQAMETRAKSSTENVLGQEKHFKTKTGKHGFAGDRPWDKNDGLAFIESQLDYLENGYRWTEWQTTSEKIAKIINDPDIVASQPNNVEYTKELVRAELGKGTYDWIQKGESEFARMLGLNKDILYQGLGTTKSIFYMVVLGFNLPFMFMSIVQPSVVMPAAYANLPKGKAGAFSTLANSMADGALLANATMRQHGLDVPQIAKLNTKQEAMLEYILANRVSEISQMSDVKDVAPLPFVETLEKSVGATISQPEMVARSITFAAFVNALEPLYKNQQALFDAAADKTKEVLGDYEHAQKALIFQRMGMIGNAASTLQTFIINQLGQIWNYTKLAKEGNPKPLLYLMGMQFLVAGATGMIGVDDLDDLWSNTKKILPHDIYIKVKDFSIKESMLTGLGKTGAYGPLSTQTGVNLYTRFSVADTLKMAPFQDDATTLGQSLAPFLVDGGKRIAALYSLMTDSSEASRKEAGYVLTPSGLRGLYEEIVPEMKRGDLVMSPKDLSKGNIRREDSKTRMLGFRGLNEQIEMDRSFDTRNREKELSDRQKEASELFKKGLVLGNAEDMAKGITRYQELGQDPRILIRGIDQALVAASLSRIEREIMKGKTGNINTMRKAIEYVRAANVR